jgi:uncharacterized protein
VGIDPRTGIVYLTEDDLRGQLDPKRPGRDTQDSFLYRYIPNDRGKRPGAPARRRPPPGARDRETGPVTDLFDQGQRFPTAWRDVRWEQAHEDALSVEAVRFNRLEGASFAGGTFWLPTRPGARSEPARSTATRRPPARWSSSSMAATRRR